MRCVPEFDVRAASIAERRGTDLGWESDVIWPPRIDLLVKDYTGWIYGFRDCTDDSKLQAGLCALPKLINDGVAFTRAFVDPNPDDYEVDVYTRACG